MAKPRNISGAVKRRIWQLPCVICGGIEDIHVDHIVPVSKGGTCEESNLQPLCWVCNIKKGNRLTNDQLRVWFEANRLDVLCQHAYRRATRYLNPYEGISYYEFKRQWLTEQQGAAHA